MANDPAISELQLITELPTNSWFEGLVIRPNGHALATRLDEPELYSWDPTKPEEPLQLVHEFEMASGLINICELEGCPDEFAVASGVVDTNEATFEDCIVWRVSYANCDDKGNPTITKIADVPDIGMCIGVMAASPRTLLLSDSGKCCIWRLDIETGDYSVLISDDTMKPATDDDFFGLNRVRIGNGYAWFTNSSAGTLYRFPVTIDDTTAESITATGPIELVADGMPHCDGLGLHPTDSAVYMMGYLTGELWKVDVDPATGKARKEAVMKDLVSPTSIEITSEKDKATAYVICCGVNEVGWTSDERSTTWGDLAAQLNASCSVTVVEEVVEAA